MSTTGTFASLDATKTSAKRRYIFALGLVALLTLAAHGTLGQMIHSLNGYAEVINKAGRQRMLSQRTTLFTLSTLGASGDAREAHMHAARDGLALFTSSHAELARAEGEPRTDLPDSVTDIYFGETQLDARVAAHVALLSVALDEGGETKRAEVQAYVDSGAPSALLRDLNRVVGAWEADADASVAFVRKFEIALLIITLLVLACEARLIFAPLVTTLGERIDEVKGLHKGLAKRDADMRLVLSSMSDGLVMIGLDGVACGVRSDAIDAMLPCWRAEEAIWSALYDDETGRATMEMGVGQFEDGFLPDELLLSQLPARVERGSQVLALDYDVVRAGENVSGLVVRVRDITQQVEAEKKQRLNADAVSLMGHVANDAAGARGFARENTDLLTRLQTRCLTDPVSLRDLHTVKGASAIYGATHFAVLIHELESSIAQGDVPAGALDEIVTYWEALMERANLGETGEFDAIVISIDEHRELLYRLRSQETHEGIAATVASWSAPDLSEPLERLQKQAERLAQDRGVEVEIDVVGAEIRAKADSLGPIWNCLVHVVRNSIAHGFDREEGPNRLTVQARTEGDTLLLDLSDNGVGIDASKLRAKAEAQGIDTSAFSLVDLVCLNGVSRKDDADDLAGRGVGMGAVRDALLAVGGSMNVVTARGAGTTFTFEIPGAAYTAEQAAAAA